MVCDRCIMVVKQLFTDLDIEFNQIQLGQIELKKEPNTEQL